MSIGGRGADAADFEKWGKSGGRMPEGRRAAY